MDNDRYNVKDALKLLKAGYHLTTIIGRKEEDFYFSKSFILISAENKSLRINEYEFLDLYKDSLFTILDDASEEAVDMKKDEEYYSWKQ